MKNSKKSKKVTRARKMSADDALLTLAMAVSRGRYPQRAIEELADCALKAGVPEGTVRALIGAEAPAPAQEQLKERLFGDGASNPDRMRERLFGKG